MMRTPPYRRIASGFTLLEVMVAMSLFTVIGLAVVMLMSTGVDMWLRGNASAQREDRVEETLPKLRNDARAIFVPPQVDRTPFNPDEPDPEKEPEATIPDFRMISGTLHYKSTAGTGESKAHTIPCRYWAFVRDLTGLSELDVYVSRAGQSPDANAYIDGKNDEDEFTKNLHLPTGGTCEVLWIYMPDPKTPGLGKISRAFRCPVGGPQTLLDPKNYDTLEKLQNNIDPQPMYQNVLYFEISFWTHMTTTWDEAVPVAGSSSGEGQAGPSRVWDSTRGILKPDVLRGFLYKGEASARFTADDIYPRRVRVQFALMEEKTWLRDPFGLNSREFAVTSTSFATGRGELIGQYVKIEEEWVELGFRESSDVFSVQKRGQHGTTPASHSADAELYYGRVVDFTVNIPSARDHVENK